MKRRILSFILIICLFATYVPSIISFAAENNDIVILYENDVHCGIEGYSKLAALKKELSETISHVGVVSVGDFIQGSSLGAVSQGEYIVNVMNLVGYDAIALGNHEFDYKLPRLLELTDILNTKPICSNFKKIGADDTVFKPYNIVSYGDIDVAYIGVTTPDTITSSSPSQFKDENGDYIYTFCETDLYNTVQEKVDAATAEGADYVIALTHLGTEDVYEKWSAQTLVKNTSGIDIVLDGHSHSVIEELVVKNKNCDDVVISSTGTKFANIGKLTISDGCIKTELISTEEYNKTDSDVDALIAQINEAYQELGNRKIGESKVDLTTEDESGNRIIRCQETNLGDFCADAFRIVTGADIGFINGGGIRSNMASGEITFNDILNVFPFNNRVCVIEATGKQIVDMLEFGLILYPEENGTFQHVSGIMFDFNKSIPSSVKLDENMVFVSVDGEYRVSNVKVLDKETGEYEPIDYEKIYTLASHNYLLLDQGGGASMFADAKVISDNGMLDVEMLEIYVKEHLGGIIGDEYKESQNRINPVDGFEKEKPDKNTDESTEITPDTDIDKEPSPDTGDSGDFAVYLSLCVLSFAVCLIAKNDMKKKS